MTIKMGLVAQPVGMAPRVGRNGGCHRRACVRLRGQRHDGGDGLWEAGRGQCSLCQRLEQAQQLGQYIRVTATSVLFVKQSYRPPQLSATLS